MYSVDIKFYLTCIRLTCSFKMIVFYFTVPNSVVNPHHFDADQDSTFHTDADPDSTFRPDADPDANPDPQHQ